MKENVPFVLENENNITRENLGKRACYVDDCGFWSKTGSCKTHHYILTNDRGLDYVDKKDGNYVKFVKSECVLIEPQPDVDEILAFKRYYNSLNRNKKFKQRPPMLTTELYYNS